MEHLAVEELVQQRAVEPLDVTVLRTRLLNLDRGRTLLSQLVQQAGCDELAIIVGADHPRPAATVEDPLQDPTDLRRTDGVGPMGTRTDLSEPIDLVDD